MADILRKEPQASPDDDIESDEEEPLVEAPPQVSMSEFSVGGWPMTMMTPGKGCVCRSQSSFHRPRNQPDSSR